MTRAGVFDYIDVFYNSNRRYTIWAAKGARGG